MSEPINHHRRRFLGTAATTIAAASLGAILNGIGHDVPQEAPDAFARAVVEVDKYTA